MKTVKKTPEQLLDDEKVIRSVLAGNKNDYELIMRRYNDRLYRIGISITKNDSAVEDIMQETYLKAYKQLQSFKGQSKFSTWLTRIMINESLAKVKQDKRLVQYSESDDETTSTADRSLLMSNKETPEKQMLQKELGNILEHAIGSLPQKYRTVFVMREVEEMSIQETAQCLKITNENVKVRLHRAKELLKTNIMSISGTPEIFPFYKTRCDRVVNFVLQRI